VITIVGDTDQVDLAAALEAGAEAVFQSVEGHVGDRRGNDAPLSGAPIRGE
jgi:hypothetical protein